MPETAQSISRPAGETLAGRWSPSRRLRTLSRKHLGFMSRSARPRHRPHRLGCMSRVGWHGRQQDWRARTKPSTPQLQPPVPEDAARVGTIPQSVPRFNLSLVGIARHTGMGLRFWGEIGTSYYWQYDYTDNAGYGMPGLFTGSSCSRYPVASLGRASSRHSRELSRVWLNAFADQFDGAQLQFTYGLHRFVHHWACGVVDHCIRRRDICRRNSKARSNECRAREDVEGLDHVDVLISCERRGRGVHPMSSSVGL